MKTDIYKHALKYLKEYIKRTPILADFYYRNILRLPLAEPELSYQELMKQGTYHIRYPETLVIALTTNCNQSCWVCNRDHVMKGNLEFDNLKKLETAIRFAKIVDLTTWGEATVYPRFTEAIEYIKSINSNPVLQLVTNGTKLNVEYAKLLAGHLHHLFISVYEAGKIEDAVLLFMDNLPDADKDKVTLSFVMHTDNYYQASPFIRLAEKWGIKNMRFVHYLALTPDRVPYTLFNIKQEWNETVDKAREEAKLLGINLSTRRFDEDEGLSSCVCTCPLNVAIIGIDGECSPCCFAPRNYSMGNVYRDGFDAMWFGEKAFRIRQNRYLKECNPCVGLLPFNDLRVHIT